MDVKLVLFVITIFVMVFVKADFFFNPISPKEEDLASSKLECVPGRTTIKVLEKLKIADAGSSSEEENQYRRSHMNFPAKDDETCQICVCSVDGKDEHCSKRPAVNVNECLRMAHIMEDYNQNMPYKFESVLSNVMRRGDLIYHNDEIPYDVSAKCYRGTSYYSNSPKANDTDLDIATSVESLLDYDTTDICFYCICSTDGNSAGCLSRDPWYCEYFRYLRTPGALASRYGRLFQQDRPAYFRHLSHRIRRTMDDGMFQMIKDFKPTGLKGGAQQCVPFVSEYSDCTEENSCSGCKQCTCNQYAQWNCETITQCLGMDSRDLNENSVDAAWNTIEQQAKQRAYVQAAKYGSPNVPRPQGYLGGEEELIAEAERTKLDYTDAEAASSGDVRRYIDSQLQSMTGDRFKRSFSANNETNDAHKVQFYHTVDELNEDTLKHSNDSGTIMAQKAIANFPPIMSRRSGDLDSANISNPLHIEYNSPVYDHHIADNNIDTQHNEKLKMYDEKLQKLIGNKTKEARDKDLSKIVVNELKQGIETVGDKKSPAISNITFTRENDTLTAMAFIAGNLLNKLWNMEKDDQGDSIETDVMKHEKIADLVDLFKEPLTIRQEMFLKDALEQLADTMTKGADHKTNIPLCEQVQKIKSDLGIGKNCTTRKNTDKSEKLETVTEKLEPKQNHTQNILRTEINNDASIAAVNKLNNVMSLIQKYEEVQKHINDLKSPPLPTIPEARTKMTTARSFGNQPDQSLTKEESQSLNLYGSVLEKITKLLVPKRKHKPIVKAIKNQSILNNNEDLKAKLKRIYDIDLENSTFTSKDKLVLDYLINFRNQKCRLTENEYNPTPIEGEILASLSEFMKIKSFVDLLNLLEPEKSMSTTELSTSFRTEAETTQSPVTETTTLETTIVTHPFTTAKDALAPTKEKLKGHLKAIITDLIELQKVSGINSKDGSIKIAEALPCLYNILNSNKISEDKKKLRLNKIKSVFDALKEELKFNPETRRANLITEPRPKSAAVWERIIKNANKNGKTRRNFDDEQPKSFEDINTLMQTMDEFSNVYKNIAILKGVPPRKRLSLVKTLDSDVRLYVHILSKMKQYLETTTTRLTPERGQTINEFLDNALINIKLDNNVLKNLYKTKDSKKVLPKSRNYKKYQTPKKSAVPKMIPEDRSDASKTSRDEIINQLIKNRVQFYLKVKELEGILKDDDVNVRLARKILSYLDTKNYSLARELFKVFVAQKQQNKTEMFSMPKPTNLMKTTPRGMLMALKEPLIQFEEEKGPAMSNDMVALTKALMKQLTNIKNFQS